jgi:hypothetical protein
VILNILQVEVERIDIGEPENPGNLAPTCTPFFNLLLLVYVMRWQTSHFVHFNAQTIGLFLRIFSRINP